MPSELPEATSFSHSESADEASNEAASATNEVTRFDTYCNGVLGRSQGSEWRGPKERALSLSIASCFYFCLYLAKDFGHVDTWAGPKARIQPLT